MAEPDLNDSASSMKMGFLGTVQKEMQDSSHVSLVDETSDRLYSDRIYDDRLQDVHKEEEPPSPQEQEDSTARRRQTRRENKNGRSLSSDGPSGPPRQHTPVRNRSFESGSRRRGTSPTRSSRPRNRSPVRTATGTADRSSQSGEVGTSSRRGKASPKNTAHFNRSFVSSTQDDEDNDLMDFDNEDDDLDESRSKGVSYTSTAPGGRNLWDASRHVVDQGVNLMDVEKGQYDRGMRGFRQKSLVDIFLTEDPSSGNIRGDDRKNGNKKKNAKKKTRACNCLLVAIVLAVSIVFVVKVPNFGLVAATNKGNKKNSATPPPTVAPTESPTKGPEEPIEEEEIEAPLPKEEDEEQIPELPEVVVEAVAENKKIDALEFHVVAKHITDQDQLDNMESPATQALHWIVEDDPAKMPIPGFQEEGTTNLEGDHILLQRYALAVFYYSMQAASTTNEERNSGRMLQLEEEALANRQAFDKSWLTAQSVCKWHGIVCDGDDESVTEINLPQHFLQGTIPRELFVGGSMPYLKKLELSGNQLQGSLPETPPGSVLEVLTLDNNQLTGSLDNMMVLTNLKEVTLEQNNLSGAIPEAIKALSSLESLQLNNNQLSGKLPGESLGELTKLEFLWLQGNAFTGKIPDALCSLTRLNELILAGNQFSGEIPDSLGDLVSLRRFFLDGNLLEGEIPSQLGHLSVLQELQLGGNSFTGEMPQEICDLRDDGKLFKLESDCTNEIVCDCCTECW